ncbi:MAG TPA: DUF4142 domain-containing protein [Thermoanaerobaculia bacterium]|nr:DUF4142 domain-containing protein [Thermoanaerobaculia bacterium]
MSAVNTPQSFIVSAYLAAAGDADVCALAARQARLPETRNLGAASYRTLAAMRNDLVFIAQRKGIALPKGMEEKKLALRDNLSQLPGRIFDEGYTLAMVQDTRAMLQMFGARINDPDVQNIVTKYRAQLQDDGREANRILNQLGGPPWPNFEP